MPHDPLTRLLQKAFRAAMQQNPSLPEQVSDAQHFRQAGRRRFIRDSTLAAASLLIAPVLKAGVPGTHANPDPNLIIDRNASCNPVSTTDPASIKVAIIGAGMAGLNAAYQLKRQGIASTVFEASGRVGGRMFTLKDQFGPGITTDIGGEFVDSTHTDILQLVKELDLELYDLSRDALTPKTFWFEGRLLGEKDLREAIQPYTDRLLKDIHSLPPVISHATADSFRPLDQLSILDYLRSIGISGWLFHFLDMVLTREYGMESAQQSAINFLIMFEPPAPADKNYELFGQDHEVFKIKGGSQHLSDKLYEQVKDQVRLQQKLVALGTNGQGGYELHFEGDDGRGAVQADQVILTLPFTILRSLSLDIPMPAEKRKCIDEIGYGNSCKFIMGMDEKPWRKAGMQGYTFTDLSFGCGWDSSQSQSEKTGSFTVFGGGNFADWVRLNKEEDLTRKFLPALDTIYKGSGTSYNGRNTKFCWAGNPYSKAGYSSFKTGQWSTLAGWEGVPVGQVYFAGEHVSREFQGYMNGAAQTGRVAAAAVAANIQNHASALNTQPPAPVFDRTISNRITQNRTIAHRTTSI
jgi:monoamine oxidase